MVTSMPNLYSIPHCVLNYNVLSWPYLFLSSYLLWSMLKQWPPTFILQCICGVDLMNPRYHIFSLSAILLLKLTWTIRPLERGHLNGHSWTTWLDLIGQNWMCQGGNLTQGKSKHGIHSLYLCLFIFLSPILSVISEFRYRGLATYHVIGSNINR